MARNITNAVEIDGGHVRVVSVNDGDVAIKEYHDTPDGQTAVDAWLSDGKPKGDYVVVWAGRSTIREVTVPTCTETALPAVFVDAALDAMNTEGQLVAGVVAGEPAPNGDRPALLGAVDENLVAPIRKKLGKDAPIILSSFAYSNDGIYLAVRASNVEMTLVSEGRVVASRFLALDGIDWLSGSLAAVHDETAKREKMVAYADALVEEVLNTQRNWARSDRFDATSSIIYIHGLGADLPGIREKITAATGIRVTEPAVPGVDVGRLNGHAHRTYMGVIAATSGATDRPGNVLRSPAEERQARNQAAADRKRTKFVAGVIAAGLLVVGMATPVVLAERNLAGSKAEYESSRSRFQSVQRFDLLGFEASEISREATSLDVGEPNWPAVLTWLQENTPDGTVFSQLSARVENGVIDVSISARTAPGPFLAPAAWLQTLLVDQGIPFAWVDSSSADEETGDVRTEIKIQLPNDTRFFWESSTIWDPVASEEPEAQAVSNVNIPSDGEETADAPPVDTAEDGGDQ